MTPTETLATYTICAALLVLKMAFSSAYTGYQRFQTKSFASPEDAKPGAGSASSGDAPAVARALRIQRNDVENIPVFLIVAFLYVLFDGSEFGVAAYCWSFTLARIGHTIAYTFELQPARAILHGIGLLATIGVASNVLWKSL